MFYCRQTQALSQLQGFYTEEATTLKDNNLYKVKSVYENLKPLHGYPGNKHLLDKLIAEMDEAVASISNSFEVLIQEIIVNTLVTSLISYKEFT